MLFNELVSLRALMAADFDTLYKWVNDRELVHFNNSYSPISDSSHRLWFESRCNNSVKGQYMFMINRNDTYETIGSCQVNEIKHIERSASLQIRIPSVEQRGKGFGTATVKLLLDFCFNDLNLNRVQIDYFATNVAAQKTYLKSGFKIEGTLRQAAYINGQWLDIIVMGMLRGEFRAQ
jgi:RimJ/RimL family protein N-acetyltransferase